MKEFFKLFFIVLWFTIVPAFAILVVLNSRNNDDNDGNNNHYSQKEVIMIEKTVIDTVYVRVPDQDAYNIGYFGGQLDAYNQYEYEVIGNDTFHVDCD